VLVENIISQIERLKKVYICKTDSDLSRILGVDKNTVCVWKKRNSIPAYIFKKISEDKNISIDWLSRGIGSMYIQDANESLLKDVSKIEFALNGPISMELLKNLCENEDIVKLIELLPHAPKPFIEQIIIRLEEFEKLSKL